MKKTLILVLFILLLPVISFAESSNIGIIKGIWFSEDVFFIGDSIRIYTAIQNNSGDDIEGTVEFLDNDISIGKKNFTALDRRIAELWIDTQVTQGKHDYSVVITEAEINKPGVAPQNVTPRVITSDSVIVADYDTDGDNIGDKEDDDDDNDGFSDTEEKKQGSDPLDSESVPTPKEPETSPEEQSLIQELLDALSGKNQNTNSTSVVSNNSETNVETTPSIETPDFIKKIEESYPVVGHVSQPLNDIQNVIVPKIVHEEKRVDAKKSPLIQKNTPNDSGDSKELIESNPKNKTTTWKYWLYSIYAWVLVVLRWIFSCLICMIILMFLVLHLILRFLFRVIGKRYRESR